MHSIDLLINKIIPLNPDYVIIMHNINDLATLMYEHTCWNQHPTRSLILDPSIPNRSPKNKWAHQTKAIGELEQLPEISNEFRKALLTFTAICNVHGIKPVLMSQANQFFDNEGKFNYLPEDFWGGNFMANYHRVVRSYTHFNKIIYEVAKEEEVMLIDLAAEIPKNSEYFYDPVHLNHNGSKLAADLISKVILDSWQKGEDR